MAKQTFNSELVEFLQSEAGSHVKVVYFNESGQWLFRSKGEFTNAVSASKITKQSVKEVAEESEEEITGQSVEEIADESEAETKPKRGRK